MIINHGFQIDEGGYKVFVEDKLVFCAGQVENYQFKPWITPSPSPHNLLTGFSQFLTEPRKPAVSPLLDDPQVRLLLGLDKPEQLLIRFPASQYHLVSSYASLFCPPTLELANWTMTPCRARKLAARLVNSTAGVVLIPPVDHVGWLKAKSLAGRLAMTRTFLVPVAGQDFDISFDNLVALNPATSTLLAYQAILKHTGQEYAA